MRPDRSRRFVGVRRDRRKGCGGTLKVRGAIEAEGAGAQYKYTSPLKAQVHVYAVQWKALFAGICRDVDADVRSYAGHIKRNCGSVLRHLFADFSLLIRCSGFSLLLLLIWLLQLTG